MIPDRKIIHYRKGNNGEIIRILLLDEFYDRLMPLFRYVKGAMGWVTIEEAPEHFERARELISSLTIEFGAAGIIFSVGLFRILRWAFNKGISIGKFGYEKIGRPATVGRPAPATLGGPLPATMGRATVMKEYPVEG